MTLINSLHLRLVWGIVEAHSRLLQDLSDEALCSWILKNVKKRLCLTYEEAGAIQQYVSSRTHLIRDIAAQK